ALEDGERVRALHVGEREDGLAADLLVRVGERRLEDGEQVRALARALRRVAARADRPLGADLLYEPAAAQDRVAPQPREPLLDALLAGLARGGGRFERSEHEERERQTAHSIPPRVLHRRR